MKLKCWSLFVVTTLLLSASTTAQDTRVPDPDPSRFHEEINSFVQWDKKNSWPKDAVLFVGSSSIRLWNTRQAFTGLDVINRGFGGAHISDVLFFYEKVVQPYKPDIIVFYCGDNDIAAGKSVERVYDDFLSFLTRAFNEIPEVRVIYLPVKPSGSRWEMWPLMDRVNTKIRLLSRKEKNLIYVDTATSLLNPEGKPEDSLFLDDRLHLNEKGYMNWKRILAPVLIGLTENSE